MDGIAICPHLASLIVWDACNLSLHHPQNLNAVCISGGNLVYYARFQGGLNMTADSTIIPPHGGYQKLKSYQMAEIVYDATVKFCARFIDRRSRTVDQMVQAARSGKQNIAEGSMASGTSKETEIKLVSVARASLEELLLDPSNKLPSGSATASTRKTISSGGWVPRAALQRSKEYQRQTIAKNSRT